MSNLGEDGFKKSEGVCYRMLVWGQSIILILTVFI